jgi:hypothetical protein
MDFQKLQKEILVALRKGLSQGQVNQRFGYSFNQVYRWEAGITQMSWADFVKFCEVL